MLESITMAEVGSIVKVSGSRIATPLGPPRPGNTPTKMPSTRPTIIRVSVFHVIRTAKPCSNRPKASIAVSQLFRHCEERSDEAIQLFLIASGLLRCARNDGVNYANTRRQLQAVPSA